MSGKKLAYLLRHGWKKETGKELGLEGWVSISDLKQFGFTRESISSIVAKDDKGRFQLDGERVRALQGHTLDSNIKYDIQVPPDLLYHGTTVGAWMDIKDKGLSKMSRHAVHMTENLILADLNAKRWKGVPIILSIDCRRMEKDGYKFEKSLNEVWLIESVPPKYIKVFKTYWNVQKDK